MTKKRVTLKLLAEETGFDISTISRVLRGDASLSIRPENVSIIKRAARELNYIPDTAARSLRSARSYSIGAILPSLQNQIHAQIVEGASRVFRDRGYSLIIAHSAGWADEREMVPDLIARNRVEGLMSLTFREDLRRFANGQASNVPFMAVNWSMPGFDSAVMLDERPGARLATEHLIDLGHRRIAHLSGDLRRFNAAERFAGYQDAHEKRNLAFPRELTQTAGYGYEDGARAMDELLDRKSGDFTAVFALSMLTAAGAIAALGRRGIRVPEDISVIGFNDGMLAEVMTPSLSTVAYPLADLGSAAAEGMISLVEKTVPTFRQVIGGAQLIQRESTRSVR
ncbi:MAG: LacI family DNA-binding transcriptional regulator [Rhodobiaceae bacterium]|nr:LacI family DNA-binding transcriptional regulator [Rhodobiaceae bacterium]